VVAGGGDLERPPRLSLAADIGEVGIGCALRDGWRLCGCELKGLGAAKMAGDLGEMGDRSDAGGGDKLSFA
jgi:hypothetical protein